MVFIHSRRIKSKQVRFRIFKFASRKLLLFVVIVLYSRNKSFPRNPSSRVSKNSSSVSKLETRSSILETRNSSLETRFSIRENIEDRESSFESRLSTYFCPVLYNSSIVGSSGALSWLLIGREHLSSDWARGCHRNGNPCPGGSWAQAEVT